MATITSGTLSFSPQLITSWSADQESRNVIHNIIGRTDPDVTLKPAATRTGKLEMLFPTYVSAGYAREVLSNGTIFTISESETWLNGLQFVLSGSISGALEDETRKLWIVTVDFTEVLT